jgi:glyoxylase-like metal-dependent hydrolase (beta-lactamase superfamily II)
VNRREFALSCFAFGSSATREPDSGLPTGVLPDWSLGELDIHHIDTGRGNATFILGPDGTTLLIDCGASDDDLGVSAPPLPDATRHPGEWTARYALRHAKAAGRETLDYLLVTHIHPDHTGDIPAGVTPATKDGFISTGVSQVYELMPATVVIDRSFPSYAELPPLNAPFAVNYLNWLKSRQRMARAVELAQVGSANQIRCVRHLPIRNSLYGF